MNTKIPLFAIAALIVIVLVSLVQRIKNRDAHGNVSITSRGVQYIAGDPMEFKAPINPWTVEQTVRASSQSRVYWGEDFKKHLGPQTASYHFVMIDMTRGGGPKIEFGLRDDGVVVWREVKP